MVVKADFVLLLQKSLCREDAAAANRINEEGRNARWADDLIFGIAVDVKLQLSLPYYDTWNGSTLC